MTNKIEGYIGCPECKTVLFRIDAQAATNPGIFEHVTVQMGDAAIGAKHCPNDGCSAVLGRVPAP